MSVVFSYLSDIAQEDAIRSGVVGRSELVRFVRLGVPDGEFGVHKCRFHLGRDVDVGV